jgi:hypothetical protein
MPRTALKAVSRTAFATAIALAAGACSQGEHVFTRQNQAASALAIMGMAAEAKNDVKLDLIYAAETKLHEACAPLREVASRRMSGDDVGFDIQLVALASLSRCESETQRVESFIWRGDPNVARFYLRPASAQTSLK